MRPLGKLVRRSPNCRTPPHKARSSVAWNSADLEKFDRVRFSEIARVLLVRPIVPMFMYTKAAAADAIAIRIIDCFRRSQATAFASCAQVTRPGITPRGTPIGEGGPNKRGRRQLAAAIDRANCRRVISISTCSSNYEAGIKLGPRSSNRSRVISETIDGLFRNHQQPNAIKL